MKKQQYKHKGEKKGKSKFQSTFLANGNYIKISIKINVL